MCGIAGIYLKNKKAAKQEGIEAFCDELLLRIESRGKQATGFVSIGWDKSARLDKAAVPASEFIKVRERFQEGTQAVLLHTRFKTKGSLEVMGNNHPVTYGSCFATHNGSIWNDDDLFKEEELSRHFQVDSEAIPAVLDKYGLKTPDTIREALEKLGGAMAIAACDPVKNPTRLLLARGKQSPLYIFENNNVIVWASELSAIRETWGKVVGTPPKADKIRFVPEGKFYIADDYNELGEYDFTPKARPATTGVGFQRSGWNSRGRNHARAQGVAFHRPWDVDGPFDTIGDYKAAVHTLRMKPPEGHKLARRWDLREKYDDIKDFTDVRGHMTWPNCICGHGVLGEDMQTHLKYGSICKDCYKAIMLEWQRLGKNAETEDSARIEELQSIPEVPDKDRVNLESWADIEVKLNRLTLQVLSDATLFSVTALEYLLFRTAAKSSDFGAGMTHLKFRLLKAYEKAYEQVTEDHWNEILTEADAEAKITTDEAQEIADQQMYPWTAFSEQKRGLRKRVRYVCEVHGDIFEFSEHCQQCVFQVDEDEAYYHAICGSEDEDRGQCGVIVEAEDEEVSIDPNKCEKCGSWYFADCVVCNRKALPAGDPAITVTETECCTKTTRDRKCKNKLAIVVENSVIGKQKGYCRWHYNRCASSKCQEETNFTSLSGVRYCHKCSRGRQGIADTAAQRDGKTSIIMEVK